MAIFNASGPSRTTERVAPLRIKLRLITPTRLNLEINIRELLAVLVAHNEARGLLFERTKAVGKR
jgi:hypothetical protein